VKAPRDADVDPYALDFFQLSRTLRWLSRFGGAWVSTLAVMAFTTVAALVAYASDTLGKSQHLHDAVEDVGRSFARVVLDRYPILHSEPEYPLMRDLPSALLSLSIAATLGLVMTQWARFNGAMVALHSKGSVESREIPPSLPPADGRSADVKDLDTAVRPDFRSKMLASLYRTYRWGWMTKPEYRTAVNGPGLLEDLVYHTNRKLYRSKGQRDRTFTSTLWVGVAACLVGALVIAVDQAHVFEVIAPQASALDGAGVASWAEDTYESWWAGSAHVPGRLIYAAIALIGFYVVILQNIAGFHAVMFIASMPSVATFHVDWANTDGHYGWEEMRAAYHTVVMSLAVHGIAVTLLVLVVGWNSILWVGPVLALYLVTVVAYVFIPRWAFRDVFSGALESRMSELREEHRVAALQNVESSQLRRLEIDELYRARAEGAHACRFTPLVGKGLDRPVLVAVFFIPVLLTVMQVMPTLID